MTNLLLVGAHACLAASWAIGIAIPAPVIQWLPYTILALARSASTLVPNPYWLLPAVLMHVEGWNVG